MVETKKKRNVMTCLRIIIGLYQFIQKKHWSLLIVIRPKFLFLQAPKDKERLMLFCDSTGKQLSDLIKDDDMRLFNKFPIEVQKLEDP